MYHLQFYIYQNISHHLKLFCFSSWFQEQFTSISWPSCFNFIQYYSCSLTAYMDNLILHWRIVFAYYPVFPSHFSIIWSPFLMDIFKCILLRIQNSIIDFLCRYLIMALEWMFFSSKHPRWLLLLCIGINYIFSRYCYFKKDEYIHTQPWFWIVLDLAQYLLV